MEKIQGMHLPRSNFSLQMRSGTPFGCAKDYSTFPRVASRLRYARGPYTGLRSNTHFVGMLQGRIASLAKTKNNDDIHIREPSKGTLQGKIASMAKTKNKRDIHIREPSKGVLDLSPV